MHVYFTGIGGSGLGPLAIIAKQAGYEVSGSDKQNSQYIDYLRHSGINDIMIGQDGSQMAAAHARRPIDLHIYTYAAPKENPNHPELVFAREHNIASEPRGVLLNRIITEKRQKLVAIAGTHGKTTTTAMTIWLFKQLGLPVSYSVGAKSSFAEMGELDANSEYFVYECDEYERNFLLFSPEYALISGIDWDHPDTYPTREEYYDAFRQFIGRSQHTLLWQADLERLGLQSSENILVVPESVKTNFHLLGEVNRANAALATRALSEITGKPMDELAELADTFPGVSRRFEALAPNIYSDYAHTPEKIRGALQLADEAAGDNVVVVYEGLHNTRQHFIKEQLPTLFKGVKKLYVVPSYLAREDSSLQLLKPSDLSALMHEPADREPAALDDKLFAQIQKHAQDGDTVLAISAGGGGSLDEWLREELARQRHN